VHGRVLSKLTRGRFVMDKPVRDDHRTPAERLAEHQASMAHRGPDPHTTRLHIRAKVGDERPLVRGMYDRTTKRKGKKT